jgi:cold shock protein
VFVANGSSLLFPDTNPIVPVLTNPEIGFARSQKIASNARGNCYFAAEVYRVLPKVKNSVNNRAIAVVLLRSRPLSNFGSAPPSDQGFQIEAVVKWFNRTKGFGFVAPADGSPDAFLHMSSLARAGLQEAAEGTKLLVFIAEGMKGRQVTQIVEVLGMGEIPQSSGGHGGHGDHGGSYGGGHSGRAAPSGPEVEMVGTVKWFKPDKGFGFVMPDDKDKDVFVHKSVVLRAGLQHLESGQRVKMHVTTSAKGREATSVEVI